MVFQPEGKVSEIWGGAFSLSAQPVDLDTSEDKAQPTLLGLPQATTCCDLH